MPRRTAQRISLNYDEMLGGSPSGLTELEIAKLIPFPGHPFKLYTGERLEKMTESVKEHGVLEPVLVWLKHEPESDTDTFIILSGHNRVNGSKLAGLDKVPVRIMENLTETEAALIVTETNLHQRSFADLTHSERAVAIHAHYEAVKAQGQNAQLVEAIERMCGVPMGNGRSIEKTCEQFGASQGTIARYLRVYELLPELRELLDTGKIPLWAGQELSWIGMEAQQTVSAVLTETEKKITEHQAKQLREQADALNENKIRKILCGTVENGKPYSLTIPRNIITQYFPEKTKKKDIAAVVEKALAMYFAQQTEAI